MAPQVAIGNQVDITTEKHHRDAVFLIFINDVVADPLLVVATRHGCVNVLSGSDADADAATSIECYVISKALRIVLRRDDEHFVFRQGTVAAGVAVEHLGVLCQFADAVFRLGTQPEFTVVVGTRGLVFHDDRHGLGIADLTRCGFVFHGSEATEGKRDTVEHLCTDRVEGLVGIGLVGAVKRFILLEDKGTIIRDGARFLRRQEVIMTVQFREVTQRHMDGRSFGVLRQHQADALPGQLWLADNSILYGLLKRKGLVFTDLLDGRLAEMISVCNALRRGNDANGKH